MIGSLRSEDNDPRPEQMTSDSDRYFGDAWERSKHEVLAEQASTTRPQHAGGSQSPATLAPGIVAMSLRGDHNDVERLMQAMRDVGIVVWRAQGRTERGGAAGYRYFSVEVPKDSHG